MILFHLAPAHNAKEKLAARNPGGKKHAAVFSSQLVYSQLMDLAKDGPLKSIHRCKQQKTNNTSDLPQGFLLFNVLQNFQKSKKS